MGAGPREPIAITGIGCRVPPDVRGPEQLWSFLVGRGDAVGEIPPDRWRWEAWYDPDGTKPGKMYVRHGSFLDQPIDAFDAGFFHVSPREAGQLDPQQRLLLEASWEAFEDAGLDVWAMRGSATGVFVGAFMLDNLAQRVEPNARDEIGPQTATTCTNTVLASRLSYFYDLRGPAFTVDTACSSSLVAVHQASQALVSGECDVALTGGVNRIFRPEPMLMMSKGQFLARDGRSKSFSANADGYGRGEGCGLVVLKRLADAERDGDRIYAVIEGSGVNQDGRTGGPAFPSSAAQAELISTVLERSEVDPASISYVEAHGTGTPVGDPAEMEALGATIGTAAGRAEPCAVGAIKAGIGHLEGAAGVMGLIKAALVAQRGEVPAQAWLDELNPAIDFDGLGLQVAAEPRKLVAGGGVRRVAVNSFGYGGTNAHAVLRRHEAGSGQEAVGPEVDRSGFFAPIAVLSGHNEAAVAELAAGYASRVRDTGFDGDKGRELLARMSRRTAHQERRVALGSVGDLPEVLDQLAADGAHPEVIAGKAPLPGEQVRPVYVFSGMGPQWWAMGRGLLEHHLGFQAHVERCDRIFEPMAGWSLREALAADEELSGMARTAVAQPCSFVLQTGLSAVLAELGIEPAAVVGHSVGEVAGAYEAGVLSLRDALCVVYHRSRLQATTAGTGAMLATDLDAEAAQVLADTAGGEVSVAALNGRKATTLAGDRDVLERLARTVVDDGGFARLLDVEVAYHSPSMDPILDDLRASLAGIDAVDARLPLYSTVGAEYDGGGWGAEYWPANARRPVEFWTALQRLVDDGYHVFLEIGAHPVLAMYLRDAVARQRDGRVVAALHHRQDDHRALAVTVARLWTAGVEVDWAPILGEAKPIDLPLYPWQRQRHWQESDTTRRVRTGGDRPDRPLAGQLVATSPATREVELSPTTLPWCPDHLVDGAAVFPATGYLELIAAHAQDRDGIGDAATVVEDLRIDRPLVLPDGRDMIARLVEDSDPTEVSVLSTERGGSGSGMTHATARIGRGRFHPPAPIKGVDNDKLVALHLDVDEMYGALAAIGLDYRGDFRAVTGIRHSDQQVEVQLEAPCEMPEGYTAYPPLLDAGLHGALAAFALVHEALYVPTAIHRAIFHAPLTPRCVAWAELVEHGDDRLVADCCFFNEDGRCLVELHGIRLNRVARRSKEEAWLDSCTYEMRWHQTTDESDEDDGDNAGTVRRLVAINPSPELRGALGELDSEDIAVDILYDANSPDLAKVGARERVVVEVPAGEPEDAADELTRVVNFLQSLAGQAGASVVLLTRRAIAVRPDDPVDGWTAGWATGLRRVADNELHQLSVHQLDHDGNNPEYVTELLSRADIRDECAVRDGQTYRPELVRLPKRDRETSWWEHHAPSRPAHDCENFTLQQTGTTLDSLIWVSERRTAPGPGEVELRVDAVGLNYKDILKQLGALPPDMTNGTFLGPNLGMEASVTVERVGPGVDHVQPGTRYLASLATGTFKHYTTVKATDARLLKDTTTLPPTEAASLLVAHGTAHKAVAELGRVTEGDVVLLHGATGSFGLAAIQVAQAHGARVLATASTPKKRAHLMEAGVEATFDSRALNFISDVREHTGGRGVDVVVNTLPGDGLRANFEVLADGGRLIDISKREILENSTLPLELFNGNITFASLDLDQLARNEDEFLALGRRVLDLIQTSIYRPVPCMTFPAGRIKDALALQARAEHTGKVVVDLTATDDLTCLEPAPEIEIRSDRTYIITGGTGGLGPHIAKWFVDSGARHIGLISRYGKLNDDGRELIDKLKADGTSVETLAVDTSDPESLSVAFDRIRDEGPPIGGIVHAAGISHDLPLEALTPEDIRVVLAPKVTGAANLDRLTQDDPIDLFLLLSSVSATTGTTGQAAYAAANAALESLAQRRRHKRLPAIALGLGPVADVGMAAQTAEVARYIELLGFQPLDVGKFADILDWLASSQPPTVRAFDLDWGAWSRAELEASSSSYLANIVSSELKQSSTHSISRHLEALTSEQRVAALADAVVEIVASTLGTYATDIHGDTRLDSLGMDSLSALEIQTRISTELGITSGFVNLTRSRNLREIVLGIEREMT